MPDPKLILLGLDGATFTVIDFLIGRGRLPHLAALARTGVRAPLTSTVPPHSAAAWPSLVTGRNPGHHGLYEFYRRRAGSYRLEPINGGSVPGPKLWQLAGAGGKRVCVFNVPISYPSEAVNGVMVSGLDTPGRESEFTYTAALRQELLARFPDYAIETDDVGRALARQQRSAGEARAERRGMLLRQLGQELAVADFLLGREPWDLAFLVITAPDRAQHLFWNEFEALRRGEPVAADSPLLAAYERADVALGRWRAQYPERSWLIVSDHGFGPLEKEFYLEQFLAEHGWLRVRSRAGRVGHLLGAALRRPGRALRPLGALLRQSAAGARQGQAALPAWVLDDPERAVDWCRTRAYAVGDTGALFLNVAGREPQGTVAPGREYEQARGELAVALQALRDPDDGRPVVEAVLRREEFYSGSALEALPDLHLRLRDYSYRVVLNYHGARGRYFGRPEARKVLYDTGAHRREGILIAAGPGFARGATLAQASLLDVLPTVLHALGLPLVAELEGRVLTEAFAPEFMAAHPVTRGVRAPAAAPAGKGYSQDEERRIAERLKQLGHLD